MPKSKTPSPPKSWQERVATWISLTVFFGSFAALVAENMAFDNTVGSMRLVWIGVGIALLIGMPGVIAIRRLDFASRDRWAACIFLMLGLGFTCVPAATFVNHRLGTLPTAVMALPVLDKEYHSATRKSGPQYWLQLRLNDRDVWVRVDSTDFDTATIGKTYTTDVQQGWLGLPVIACKDCW